MDSTQSWITASQKNGEQVAAFIEKIYGAARPGAVFGEPVTNGSYTVITALEISSGGGFGSGMGFGSGASNSARNAEAGDASSPGAGADTGGGGGIAGGGGAMSRPVAAITIGPDGVTIEPIIDRTKVVLAGITMLVTMIAVFGRTMRKR